MVYDIGRSHSPRIGQTDTRAQVVDSFLLKILAVEAAILIIVGFGRGDGTRLFRLVVELKTIPG
jgi:hypothetical protein